MKRYFVTGYMHSGTTLVQSIIGNHDLVFSCKGESGYFDMLPEIRRKFGFLENAKRLEPLVVYILNLILHGLEFAKHNSKFKEVPEISESDIQSLMVSLQKTVSFVSLFRDVADFVATRKGCDAWLEKTPTHILYFEEIRKSMPNVQFVNLIRDPRDILASKKTRRKTVWTDRYNKSVRKKKHYEKAYDPVLDTWSWKSIVVAGNSAFLEWPENVYNVRYEDLVTNPEKITKNICEFLRLNFNNCMLEVGPGIPAERSLNSIPGIRSHSVGRWKTTLSGAEVAVCQRICRGEMISCKYSREKVTILDKIASICLYFRSGFNLLSRVYRRWRLGGSSLVRKILFGYYKRLRALLRNS